ncbi:uncharacterized protein LOC114526163 isoform X2 [Dendronephthya gigantea]|uniref:uncharacterized protein LOC114526163 isoform X2 n=1 Tax=Dendronephthya gigantea TaxID=151771 RepID=UPI001069C963|nr:uncharacterized protein LOC114526163 isoform X2 [Dendronephthya gigantea]
MTRNVYLRFSVFVLLMALVCFVHESSTSSLRGKNVFFYSRMETCNLTSASVKRRDDKIKLQMNKSDVENILKLMLQYTTNVVEIELTIHSKNNTRSFPKYKWSWASEVGRTVISLIERPFIKLNYKPSSLHFITLKRGIKKVNVVVFEEIDGCLPTGNKGSELVFDFLLRQLSHSDDTHDYKLCRPHDDEDGLKQYNCCRITTNELSVCDDYFSNIIDQASSYIVAVTILVGFFGFPLIIQYLQISENNGPNEDYGISDSPLTLKTVLYDLFVEGSSPNRSRLRRFFLWLITTILFYISSSYFIIPSIVFLVFMPFDIFLLNKFGKQGKEIYKSYIFTITSPFNPQLWWKIFDKLVLQKFETTVCKICIAIVSTIFFPLFYAIVCIVSFPSLTSAVLYGTFLTGRPVQGAWERIGNFLRSVVAPLAVGLFILSLVVFLNIMLPLIAGIYLNGQIFGPYFTPIAGVVIYSLKHWRWSVEAKYLVLKTDIYEVCKKIWEDPHNGRQNKQPPGGENQQPPARQKNFTVNVKDGRIPKILYKEIRKLILPLNKSLFFFFLQIFLVANFFFVVVVMMLLAQKSNISGQVQIMSTIALSTLPFIFDTIWVEDTCEQKSADSLKQQKEIKEIMTFVSKDVTTITVKVDTEEEIRIEKWTDVFLAFNPLWKHYQQDHPGNDAKNAKAGQNNSQSTPEVPANIARRSTRDRRAPQRYGNPLLGK